MLYYGCSLCSQFVIVFVWVCFFNVIVVTILCILLYFMSINKKNRSIKFKQEINDKIDSYINSDKELRSEIGDLKLEFHREIRTHRAEPPDVEVTMCLGPMPPDAFAFSGGIPA